MDFSDRNDNFVPEKWHYQPIYGSPTVVSSNSVDASGNMTYDIPIFFGAGDYNNSTRQGGIPHIDTAWWRERF